MQIKKIVSGLFLVLLSIALALAAFYQWEVKPELATRTEDKEVIQEQAKEAAQDKPPSKKLLIP